MADKGAQVPGSADWRPNEEDYRKREVNRQLISAIFQPLVAVAAIIAAFAAGCAAVRAGEAISVAKQGIQSQADENRLKTAVDAIGGGAPTQRVAGLTLLRRLVIQRLENAADGDASDSDRRDALKLFRATVDILATYLKNPPAPSTPFAFGDPNLGPDFSYAAADLNQWLQVKAKFLRVAKGDRKELPNVDLKGAELYGVSWRSVDFSWLGARYLLGVDLRRASLEDSKWGESTFTEAHLGCARLDSAHLRRSIFSAADLHSASLKNADLRRGKFSGANLAGADLTSVDLRGADLISANLRGADLTGAKLKGADLTGADLTGANLINAQIDSGALDRAIQQEPPPDSASPSDPVCPAPTS